MAAYERFLDRLDHLARRLTSVLCCLIIAILVAQIGFRYLLNSSIVWSEEVATWCMVWLVFLGAASIMRRWEHVNIPMLIRALPLDWRPAFIVFSKVATVVAVTLVAWYGVQVVMGTFHIRSQTSGINSRWIKLAVPIGAGLMAIFALQCVVEDLRRWVRGDLGYFAAYGDLGIDESDSTAIQRAAPGS
jgi:TRAP-type C4-dicarboxylate transport system permease small subunit